MNGGVETDSLREFVWQHSECETGSRSKQLTGSPGLPGKPGRPVGPCKVTNMR